MNKEIITVDNDGVIIGKVTEEMLDNTIENMFTSISRNLKDNNELLAKEKSILTRLYVAKLQDCSKVYIEQSDISYAEAHSSIGAPWISGLPEIINHCKMRAMLSINLREYAIRYREDGDIDNDSYEKLIDLSVALLNDNCTHEQLGEAIEQCVL